MSKARRTLAVANIWGAWEGNGREIRIATPREGRKQQLALKVKGEAAI
jgi:hypothetical protein